MDEIEHLMSIISFLFLYIFCLDVKKKENDNACKTNYKEYCFIYKKNYCFVCKYETNLYICKSFKVVIITNF